MERPCQKDVKVSLMAPVYSRTGWDMASPVTSW
jgi:hypothetical protein